MANKIFGETLRQLRKNSNYTQQQISNLLGLKNKSTLGSWEVGKSEPDGYTFLKLCKLYNISDVYSVFNINSSLNTDTSTVSIIQNYESKKQEDLSFTPCDMYKNFGKQLLKLRQQKSLTQADLANQLNIAQSTYAGYETGKRKINLELIQQFSIFFNISPSYFFNNFNSDNSESLSLQEQNLIKKYRTLDERGKETVDAVLNTQCGFVSGNRQTSTTDPLIRIGEDS